MDLLFLLVHFIRAVKRDKWLGQHNQICILKQLLCNMENRSLGTGAGADRQKAAQDPSWEMMLAWIKLYKNEELTGTRDVEEIKWLLDAFDTGDKGQEATRIGFLNIWMDEGTIHWSRCSGLNGALPRCLHVRTCGCDLIWIKGPCRGIYELGSWDEIILDFSRIF